MSSLSARRLAGRGTIVTGAASGIGAAVAHRLAVEGAAVLVADVRDDPGRALVDELRGAGATAHYRRTDVTNRADVRAMVADADRLLGGVRILVNNAMADPRDDWSEDERWDAMIESGLSAYWAAAVAAASRMRGAGGGAIVSVSSIAGAKLGIEFSSEAYASAKAGVVGLTRRLAQRLGPQGIRVNCVCPGIIETPRWRTPGAPEPRFASRWKAMAPLGRYGRADEVAALVAFLASDEASFVSGEAIAVDGGFSSALRFVDVEF